MRVRVPPEASRADGVTGRRCCGGSPPRATPPSSARGPALGRDEDGELRVALERLHHERRRGVADGAKRLQLGGCAGERRCTLERAHEAQAVGLFGDRRRDDDGVPPARGHTHEALGQGGDVQQQPPLPDECGVTRRKRQPGDEDRGAPVEREGRRDDPARGRPQRRRRLREQDRNRRVEPGTHGPSIGPEGGGARADALGRNVPFGPLKGTFRPESPARVTFRSDETHLEPPLRDVSA